MIDTIFSVSSMLTPFALGAAIGAIATGRVPVGNASGHLFSSWLNPTSIFIGVLAVANCAYLAAVYLAADAARLGERALERAFRRRALGAGVVAGAVALGGIVVVNSDYHRLFHALLTGDALAAVIVSFLAGVTRSRSSGGGASTRRVSARPSPSRRSSPAGRLPAGPPSSRVSPSTTRRRDTTHSSGSS